CRSRVSSFAEVLIWHTVWRIICTGKSSHLLVRAKFSFTMYLCAASLCDQRWAWTDCGRTMYCISLLPQQHFMSHNAVSISCYLNQTLRTLYLPQEPRHWRNSTRGKYATLR